MMVQWLKILGVVGFVLGCNKVAAVGSDTESGISVAPSGGAAVDTASFDSGIESHSASHADSAGDSNTSAQQISTDTHMVSRPVTAIFTTDNTPDSVDTDSFNGSDAIQPSTDTVSAAAADSASAAADASSDDETLPHVAYVFDRATATYSHELVPTYGMLIAGVDGCMRDLRLNTTSGGDIVVTGTTTDPVALGMPPEQLREDDNPRYVFIWVISAAGEILYRWFYEDLTPIRFLSVTADDKLVWVGSRSTQDIRIGEEVLYGSSSSYVYTSIDLHTGLPDFLSEVFVYNFVSDETLGAVNGLAVDASGNLYLSGAVRRKDDFRDRASLTKFDAAGQLLWHDSWPSCEYSAHLSDVVMTSDDIVAGVGSFNCSLFIGEDELHVSNPSGEKYYSDGVVTWVNAESGTPFQTIQVGGNNNEYLATVDAAADGAIRVSGILEESMSLLDWWIPAEQGAKFIMEMSAAGEISWITTLPDLGAVAVDEWNRTHLTAYFVSEDGGTAFSSLMALDENGMPMAMTAFENNGAQSTQVALDGDGGIWIAGGSNDNMITPFGNYLDIEADSGFLFRFELVETNNAGG